MAATYEPIATTTLSSPVSSITFSSIPSTFTDLRLVLSCPGFSSYNDLTAFEFNNDTGSNYALCRLRGDGSSATSSAVSSDTKLTPMNANTSAGYPFFITFDILSYANTSVYKTALISFNNDQFGSSGNIGRCVGIWRSASALSTIKIYTGINAIFNTFPNNTTATIYGILKA